MTQALIWMPVLDVANIPGPFFDWAADRFLKQHGGVGHIIADHIGPWPSFEVVKPTLDGHWYCRRIQTVTKKAKPQDITIELLVPQGAEDPALVLLDKVQKAGPIRRLVVKRPTGLSLARCQVSLQTLSETITPELWLDVDSFGWDAVSFLCAGTPRFQISGVADYDLSQLSHLAALLERPLFMSDLSDRRPRPILGLPEYHDEKGAARVLKTLPTWGRSR